MTAARRPPFYLEYGVPDTKEGRFALIVVHTFLVLERLRAEGAAGAELARALTEAFVTDMDDSMREIGIGDLGVPRQVKRAAAALGQSVRAMHAALAEAGSGGLAGAIERTLLPGPGEAAAAVAGYVRRSVPVIAHQPAARVLAGDIDFPPPREVDAAN